MSEWIGLSVTWVMKTSEVRRWFITAMVWTLSVPMAFSNSGFISFTRWWFFPKTILRVSELSLRFRINFSTESIWILMLNFENSSLNLSSLSWVVWKKTVAVQKKVSFHDLAYIPEVQIFYAWNCQIVWSGEVQESRDNLSLQVGQSVCA